jgi:hypothetical protein
MPGRYSAPPLVRRQSFQRARPGYCAGGMSLAQEKVFLCQGNTMPDKKTLERALKDRREGRAASTQAGEFVREEIEHIREGKHGARSAKQAIAIGLSKARRAGVQLPPPRKGTVAEKTRRSAKLASEAGQRGASSVSLTRSRAVSGVLQREGHAAASTSALAKQARSAARRRSVAERSTAAKKAVRTKGLAERSAAARKAARTRARSHTGG